MIHGVLSFHVCLQYEPLAYLSICMSSHNAQLLFIHTSLLTWKPGWLELNCIQNRICVMYVIKHIYTHTQTHTNTHTHVAAAVQPLSRVHLFVTPWTVARQAPLSMGFSRGILEQVTISFFKESSQPKDRTLISCIGRWILYHWTI